MQVKILDRKIKAVTFDFWWTLFKDKNGSADGNDYHWRLEYLQEVCKSKGASKTKHEISLAYNEGRKFFEQHHKKGLFTSSEEVLQVVFNHLGIKLEKPELRQISNNISHFGSLSELVLLEGALEVLRFLKENNVRIGLISDTVLTKGKHLVVHLRRHGILKYFDYLVFSDEVGAVKPNPYIFNYALKKLGAYPEESAHIGDFPWSDIEGALNIGCLAIQYIGGNGPERNNIHPKANIVIESFYDILKIAK
ncbi:MAG: HAD family hydrolase [Actinobacteria bacterium]|nr:HAD family hydrolase [Actinomycetota bacterium]